MERLGTYDTNTQIAIIWGIDDVQAINSKLTDEEAMNILRDVQNHHDASIGINWDVLQEYVNQAA